VEVVPDDDRTGHVSLAALEQMIDERTRVVALTHVPSHSGLVNPAEEVGRIANAAGVPFLLDACQSIGQMPLDVDALGCDILSAPGRKFLRGPRGTGLLYVRERLVEQLEPPFLDLLAATWTAPDRYEIRADARRFESWEADYAARIGLGVAVAYALAIGLDAIEARVRDLADRLRAALGTVPGIEVRDLGEHSCGIVTFTCEGWPAAEVVEHLAGLAINVSQAPAEYSQWDLGRRGLDAVVRASVHYYNTDDEIDRLVDALRPRARRKP
jgi:selenocysteine lyase/cysteine desulfurase